MPYADLTDARCYFEIEGAGEPLVLVPGLGRDGTSWDGVVEVLASRFTVIRPDNRGIGRSRCKRQPRRVRDYAADLLELLDHLQIERTHLLGLSLGGIIAQRFAVDHPSRVSRLVLLSCAQGFGPYLREMTGVIARGLRFPPKPSVLQTVELLSTSPVHLDANPTFVRDKLKNRRRSPISPGAVLRQLRALGASRFEEGEYQIDVPTLVIAGEFDALIPHCYAQRMAEMIPRSEYVVLPGVGHNPITEAPGQVLPRIVAFLHEREGAEGRRTRHRTPLTTPRRLSQTTTPPALEIGGPAS